MCKSPHRPCFVLLQKEDKIKDLNRRVQLKAQQRAKLQTGDTLVTSKPTDASQVRISDDVVIVNNSVPHSNRVDSLSNSNPSDEPHVGTLVTIATTNSSDGGGSNAAVVANSASQQQQPPAATTSQSKTREPDTRAAVSTAEAVARPDGVVAKGNMATLDSSLGIAVDGNSDSALPTTSSTATTKSSKTSGYATEELESYC